jgi:hypothetical protein
MPPTWRAKLSQRQGARAALNRPRLVDTGTPEPPAAPRDPFVDYPPLLRMAHPEWWHVYRIERTGPVLIAECRTEEAAHFVMSRERWRTRMQKWKHESFESFRPLHPGA